MRISDVRATILSAPIPAGSRVRSGVGLKYARTSTFVEVLTDEGVTGLGSCLGNPPSAIKAIVEDVFKPALVGRDPFEIEAIWRDLYIGRLERSSGPRGIGVGALSGIDIALWDIKGKALGVPIYQLLGGAAHPKVRAYASSVYWQAPESAYEEARRYVDQGYTGVKVKIGGDLDRDLAMVAAVREAIGPKVDLFVDANVCYTTKLALKVVRELERQNVFWFEEPIPFDDLDGQKLLSDATSVRIAAGENNYTRYGFRDLIGRKAVDVVQPDTARCGGISEIRKIGAMATANDLLFVPHSFGDAALELAALHVIASTPEAFIIEHDITHNPLRSELGGALLEARDGYLPLPDRPGLGVELTDEIREKYAYRGGTDISVAVRPALGLVGEDLADRRAT
jgi:D-galactarolactone cycloisomerase